jgi:hypothetical protein
MGLEKMPKRVLFVFVLPSGGVDTLNRMRIQALAGRNIDSHLLYFQSGSGAQNKLTGSATRFAISA